MTWSYTEPTLFHAGCRPILHVGLLQHLYLTYSLERHSTHIHLGWNTSYSQWWKSSILPSRMEHILLTMMEYFLTFIQARTHPDHNDERLSSRMEHILLTMMKYFCTSIQAGTHPTHNDGRLSSRLEHILLTMMKDFCIYIHPSGNTSCSQWWKGSALTFI